MREYREYYEESSSSDKTLWIILGIVGGVILLGVLACGGLAFVAVRGMQAGMAQVAANLQQQFEDLDLQEEDYAEARRQFKTKLFRQGPTPQQWKPVKLPGGTQEVEVRSGDLRLKAWVNPPRDAGQRKLAAVLFLHDGWAFGVEDWAMAKPFRDAGYVVMMPILRGENGQAGSFSMFYDEVDDALAAADHLSKLPYVDDKHIYVAGHSEGGTLALLAALTSPRFRAAASFSGSPNQRIFVQTGQQAAPFNQADPREFEMRSPLAYATSFKCPLRIYYGDQDFLLIEPSETTATRARTKGLDVSAVSVQGNQVTALSEAMRQAIQFFKEKQ